MKLLAILGLMMILGFSAPAQAQKVLLETSMGNIKLELYPDKAPKSVENFLAYVNAGFYSGTIFHRVIDGFMIQGGGFTKDLQRKETRSPIQNEADNGQSNKRGTIAMARTPDPHSASSQFFINVKDNNFLDHTGKNAQGWGYAVFGKVVEGMDVADKIAKVKTGSCGPFPKDCPNEAIVILKASLEK